MVGVCGGIRRIQAKTNSQNFEPAGSGKKHPASQSFRLRYASPRQAAGTRKAESRKKREKRKEKK
jgi:hypothetical protein